MMEVPRMWAFIINPQDQKMLRKFQNTIKYHEESLEKLEALFSNHLAFLIRNMLVHASPTTGLTSTLSGGPKILELLRFPRMIVMFFLEKSPTLWAQDLVDISSILTFLTN
jgi:hypothetical protein